MQTTITVNVEAQIPIGQSVQAARELIKSRIEAAINDPRAGLWPMLAVSSYSVTIEDEPTAQAASIPE